MMCFKWCRFIFFNMNTICFVASELLLGNQDYSDKEKKMTLGILALSESTSSLPKNWLRDLCHISDHTCLPRKRAQDSGLGQHLFISKTLHRTQSASRNMPEYQTRVS